MQADRTLQLAIVVYGTASLVHFAHNAAYAHDYPNMPAWLSTTDIGIAWCALTAVGVLGWYLYRHVSRGAGALAMAVYGVLGFGGLDHYTLAPIAAHTVVMNLTIACEAVAAGALLWCIVRSLNRQ
jgi:hypothetical protein